MLLERIGKFMPIPQQKFREVVFILLYSQDNGNGVIEEMVPLVMKELAVTKKTVYQALAKVELIWSKREEIDALITKTSRDYQFERIQTVERNVLRLAIYEMLFDESIPPKVAIAEAIRLSRKFSTPESTSFVNALLDHIYRDPEGKNQDAETIVKSAAILEKSTAQINELIQAQERGEISFQPVKNETDEIEE
jgi:N utilization substance protein B